MRTAAQLLREVVDGQHAHLVGILFAKQRHGAGVHGLVKVHDLRDNLFVLEDLLVHQVFDIEQVLLIQPRVVGEVEPQAVRRHQRPGLLDVRAQRPPQSRMQQVRGRMVAPGGIAPLNVHFCRHHIADAYCVARFGLVNDQPAHGMVSVRHVCYLVVTACCQKMPDIAHLPARFSVEGRMVENDFELLPRADRLNAGRRFSRGGSRTAPTGDQRQNATVRGRCLSVAIKNRLPRLCQLQKQRRGYLLLDRLPTGPRPLALLLHFGFVALIIDSDTIALDNVPQKVRTKAKCVV